MGAACLHATVLQANCNLSQSEVRLAANAVYIIKRATLKLPHEPSNDCECSVSTAVTDQKAFQISCVMIPVSWPHAPPHYDSAARASCVKTALRGKIPLATTFSRVAAGSATKSVKTSPRWARVQQT